MGRTDQVIPVSVVVPCYRSAQTIGRALASVAKQTARVMEVIVIDDASDADTAVVLRELQTRYGADWLRIIRLESNVGPASARNTGWNAARGDYVAFLDADDAWHPRKAEIQYAWMAAHPEVVVTGHDSKQLRAGEQIPEDCGDGETTLVTRDALLASNRFITPSVMLRREIRQRFEQGKRYMEDYLLWLEIALAGQQIFRLPQVLAYTFKAPFGDSGQSANAWSMEKGELAAFATLRRNGLISMGAFALLSVYSMLKFLRRLGMLTLGFRTGTGGVRPEILFPIAYLALTQAMTALLVGAGLFGHGELAADIGLAQAATLATFFALSGNARNLILSARARVTLAPIVATRLALIIPLGAGAFLLCIAARGDAALALALVVRRAVEWIGELELSERELVGDLPGARWSLLLQIGLLAGALGVIAFAPEYVLWAIWAWALGPLITASRFVKSAFHRSIGQVRYAIGILLPHLGSTAVSGVSLYIYRALLVLVAEKAVAGDLFAAFAIGSFLGSMYANVLGASASLHEERGGGAYFAGTLRAALAACIGTGLLILGLAWMRADLLAQTHKSLLFWWAAGWSLVGGGIMLVAQRVRLRLIAQSHGERVFGPDVLIHVCLIMAVPALFATGSANGLAALYLLNAILALVFYATADRGVAERLGERFRSPSVTLITFGVFFPLFLQISTGIFNPVDPMWDSGGVLRDVPIPVSLLVVGAGLVMLGRFGAAAPLWTTLGFLVLMMLSTVTLGGTSGGASREKMLLMLQVLLPILGLVLGSIADPDRKLELRISQAIIVVIALIVPAQLLSSWLGGSLTLTHSLRLFAVYQHWQYVPVILASGFLVGVPSVWQGAGRGRRFGLSALFGLLGVYAVAANSVLATASVLLGASVFAGVRFARARDVAAIVACVVAILSVAGYGIMVRHTDAFMEKFGDLLPEEGLVRILWQYDSVEKGSEGWRIRSDGGLGPGTWLMKIAPPGRRQGTVLHVQGNLSQGGLALALLERYSSEPGKPVPIDRIGTFDAEISTGRDGGGVLLYQYGASAHAELSMQWRELISNSTQDEGETGRIGKAVGARGKEGNSKSETAGQSQSDGGHGSTATAKGSSTQATPPRPGSSHPVPEGKTEVEMRNILERFADWRLFGSGLVESPQAFFFGHLKPLPREVRSSAHNFYLDFAYNFGVLALLPLLILIAYTGTLLWRNRGTVHSSESLLMLAGVVIFLVLIESNLKVTLRQPYPGIAVYFLWGLLLARLRAPAAAHRAA